MRDGERRSERGRAVVRGNGLLLLTNSREKLLQNRLHEMVTILLFSSRPQCRILKSV